MYSPPKDWRLLLGEVGKAHFEATAYQWLKMVHGTGVTVRWNPLWPSLPHLKMRGTSRSGRGCEDTRCSVNGIDSFDGLLFDVSWLRFSTYMSENSYIKTRNCTGILTMCERTIASNSLKLSFVLNLSHIASE